MWNDEKEDDDDDNDTKDDGIWRFSDRSSFLSKFDMKDADGSQPKMQYCRYMKVIPHPQMVIGMFIVVVFILKIILILW